ncbi:hypothetical protein [Qipengyuania atrilutea]|uniref:Uncharacterized protein n=1 Tax=Qipengyuania atrilutea TaxID=2744473 RepID=A0A850H368_9SPHN|nr:hypothetical protein [Actirhodobacter atriluteus]NVD43495.1 hypothetical protein [Actirhodobacter atriluteus]
MAEADVTLRFEIVDGETPDAENVIRALSAYVSILKTAGEIVAPGRQMEVGLSGVEDGSDIFKFILRACENFGETLIEGMSEFPIVSKATITLGGLIGGTMIGIGLENRFSDDPRLPPDQMAVFEEQNQLLRESNDLQKREMEFYGILHEEPAYRSIDIIRPYGGGTVHTVPKSEFASRSGLWGGDDDPVVDPSSQTITDTWNVVLIKATLVPEPRRWRFAKEGLEFSALMKDQHFLDAIHDKTLPVTLAEGIRMKVEVKYREEYTNEGWVPVIGSHRVTKVLRPLPPGTPIPLFPDASAPKE